MPDALLGLVNALLQRDRLLHYNATTAKRTHVIDDELDYFVSEGTGAAAVWLDPETRKRVAKRVEELRSQREASRRQTSRICIDFANRTVTEEVYPDRRLLVFSLGPISWFSRRSIGNPG